MSHRKTILVTSLLIILLGLLVIVGWSFDITLLKSVIPGYNSMKFNTAISLIISGFTLYTLSEQKSQNIAITLSCALLLINLASFSQDIFGYNAGIDQLLFVDDESIRDGSLYPGRMAPTTAFCFALLGLSFLLIQLNVTKIIGQFILHLISLISFIAMVGYIFKVPTFYTLSFLSSMAVHTALSLFLLSISISLLNPSLGLTDLFVGKTPGRRMAQRLFPKMVIALLVLGLLRIEAHRFNLIDAEFGNALFAISFLVVGLFLIWETAISLDKTDAQRTRAETEVRNLNENLENTIRKRTRELDESIVRLKHNELVLWRSEQLLKGIINNTSASIFVKDKEGKYILVNKTFAANFSKVPSEVIGKTAFDIFPQHLAEKLTENEAQIFEKGTFLNYEATAQSGGHKEVISLTNKFPLYDESNTAFALCGIATDITELRKAEASIKAIFNSAQVSIIATDLSGIITDFNKGAESLLGYAAGDIVGKETPAIIHVEDEVARRGNELTKELGRKISGVDVFLEYARQGKYESREWTYVRKNGTSFPVQLVVTAIQDKNKNLKGFLGIGTDISVLKAQQNTIQTQKKELEALNATKDRFFSIVAHDLKSPLNSLKGFSTLLISYYDSFSKEEILAMSQQLKDSVDNTIKMADNLITWARIQMREFEYRPQLIKVNEIASTICEVYSYIASSKGIHLNCSIDDSLTIWGDKNQIEFIIRNLVNNAIKFTNKDGFVRLTARQLPDKKIEISVSDSGVGISDRMKDKLFSIGEKQSTNGTAGEKGTGLGLMLSYEFVTLNGGQIDFESTEGKGTTFHMKFNDSNPNL